MQSVAGQLTYHNSNNGGVESAFDAVGVVDWRRVYASVFFPVSGNRSILIGWTYVSNLPKFIVVVNSPIGLLNSTAVLWLWR
jgi:hypothetical protein